MSSGQVRKLKLVPFNPSDYSLGETLTKDHGTRLEDSDQIGAALSLYFQWEEYRDCVLYPGETPTVTPTTCILDYDRDERTPSELRLTFTNIKCPKLEAFQKTLIRFEVFRTCYEFQADILAVSEDPETDGWHAVLSTPAALTVYKTRRLPRVAVSEDVASQSKSIEWHAQGESTPTILALTEIGLRSFRAKSSKPIKQGAGHLFFENLRFNAEAIRSDKETSVFQLSFATPMEFGQYFDLYRKFAYPYLRPRTDFPNKECLDLYVKSNYFGKFEGTHKEEQLSAISTDWDGLKTGIHDTHADYVIIDDHGQPTGTSGVALSFFQKETPVWVFHQLCALKTPELVERSGNLYTWRAEYLAARPEELAVAVWFDSKSRWLERLYVKFASQTNTNTRLHKVQDKHCQFRKTPAAPEMEIRQYKVGKATRSATSKTELWGGIGPRHLNANGYLDCIVSLWGEIKPDEIKKAANHLLNASGIEEISFLVTVPDGTDLSALDGRPQLSDRFCTFPKAALIDFLASVEHSLAITHRKLNDA